MTTVTLSPKYQVVIPKEAREQMELESGTKLEVIVYGDRIELIPIYSIKKLRGSLRGIDTTVVREPDRI